MCTGGARASDKRRTGHPEQTMEENSLGNPEPRDTHAHGHACSNIIYFDAFILIANSEMVR